MAYQRDESFRDSIGTITQEGKRNYIHPKKPKGKFYRYRTWLSWLLLAMFFIFPFVKINGNQLFLFNVLGRRFNILGHPFFPQDFHIFAIGIGLSVVFIIVFTIIFGRIFCGWLCPQTIFMEMVFRKIEYLIEGDRTKQIKLQKSPWNAHKIRVKVTKWIVFAIVSLIITNTMMMYVMGTDKVLQYYREGIFNHLGTFIPLLVFTAVFYFVFAWFREQACIIVCPYGRLQGVLLDNNTINVAYDYVRGEGEKGRAKFRKGQDRKAEGYGDCVDCKQCVLVCPTGIDIRNGTQMECINCTACIDACDATMRSVGFETGLIRYASENNISRGEPFRFGLRQKFYTAVLLILLGLLIGLLVYRGESETTILRVPGTTYKELPGGIIENKFDYDIVNKSTHDLEDITFKLIKHEGTVENSYKDLDVPKLEKGIGRLTVRIPKQELHSYKEKITIGVYSGGKLIEKVKVKFSGPLSLGR